MKQYYYTLMNTLKGKNNNPVKIISLTLGFCVGLVLLARVAFEISFDNYYKDVDQLYCVTNHAIINGDDYGVNNQVINAPIPSLLMTELPEIESATVVYRPFTLPFFYDEQKYTPRTLYADSLFFRTMGLEVIRGDENKLGLKDHLFISKKYATLIFGQEDPVGKQVLYGKNHPYTIAGIFNNIPENSHLRFDAVGSFINMKTQFGRIGDMESDDSYLGYVRFKPNTNIQAARDKWPELLEKYVPVEEMQEMGIFVSFDFYPVTDIYTKSPEVQRMIIIMSLLALAILFIAAMNYVLISISSMVSKAKMVGIHKCNGASDNNIFRLFVDETITIIIISLAGTLLLLLACRKWVEEISAASFSSLFARGNLWLPVTVFILICLIVTVIPGRIFAKIPVTQIFQTYTTAKRSWKNILLFIQFGGIALVFTLLAVILLQYNFIMEKDLGYNPENIVYAHLKGVDTKEKLNMLTEEFNSLSYVKAMGNSSDEITTDYGGRPIFDKDLNWLFTARGAEYDANYLNVMEIDLVAGRNVERNGELLVNEAYVKRMKWQENPIGQTVGFGDKIWGTIVGVMKDYNLSSLYYEKNTPIFIWGKDFIPNGMFTLRLKELTSERLDELNNKMAELCPQEDISFSVLTDQIKNQYEGTRHFRDAVILASVVIFIIALMGLFGYIQDEVIRRSKEIAIRKINGASASSILSILSKDVTFTAFPAIILGVMCSGFIAVAWLKQFAEKITLNAFIFILSALFVFTVIILCVIFKSWNTANENPITSIKSE